MALVNGTNFGFVETAPVGDPGGGGNSALDGFAKAIKVVAPAGATAITEIGWWCHAVSESTNFEVGLYSHNAGSDKPGSRLFVDDTNAVGSAGTWQTVAVDWAITAGTTYWIAVQVDAATGTTYEEWGSVASERYSTASAASLAATWEVGSSQVDNVALAYYAAYSATENVEISGAAGGTSGASGTLTVETVVSLSGTAGGASTAGGALGVTLSITPNWQTGLGSPTKRLIQIGNDSLYYEDV